MNNKIKFTKVPFDSEEEQQLVRENNLVLARYIGYTNQKKYLWQLTKDEIRTQISLPFNIFVGDNVSSFKFHESWDWLMVVYSVLREDEQFTNIDITDKLFQLYYKVEQELLHADKAGFYNSLVEIIKYLNEK